MQDTPSGLECLQSQLEEIEARSLLVPAREGGRVLMGPEYLPACAPPAGGGGSVGGRAAAGGRREGQLAPGAARGLRRLFAVRPCRRCRAQRHCLPPLRAPWRASSPAAVPVPQGLPLGSSAQSAGLHRGAQVGGPPHPEAGHWSLLCRQTCLAHSSWPGSGLLRMACGCERCPPSVLGCLVHAHPYMSAHARQCEADWLLPPCLQAPGRGDSTRGG